LREESPSITGQGCLLTAGEGDFKESEQKYTADVPSVRLEWRGKSSPYPR